MCLSVVPKSPVRYAINDTATDKHPSSDEHLEKTLFNPLVASTVDDFVPDDNDYETFLVDDNLSHPQNLPIDPFVKSTVAKPVTTTDEFVGRTGTNCEIVSFRFSETEATINPMVKGFREQLDSDDEQHHQRAV